MDKSYTLLTRIQFYELEEVSGDKLVIYNNQCYHVGEMLYYCIQSLKKGLGLPEITSLLNNQHQSDFKEDEIGTVLSNAIDNIENQSKQKAIGIIDNIYIKKKILGKKTISRIAKNFLLLYDKKVVVCILALFVFSLYYVFKVNGEKFSFVSEYVTSNLVVTIFSSYFLLPLVGLWHEIGHAAASLRLGIKPKEIGFGIYLIFPVFYTDVSDIWRLDKRKRVVVNLGGIYFQIILSCILAALFCLIDNPYALSIILSIFMTNLFILAYAVVPFFRNDGYWIYSDLFHIPNLSYRSKHYPTIVKKLIFDKNISAREKLHVLKSNIALMLYSICDISLSTLMMASILLMTAWNIAQILQFSSYIGYTPALYLVQKGLFITLSLALNILFLYRICAYLVSLIRNKFLI